MANARVKREDTSTDSPTDEFVYEAPEEQIVDHVHVNQEPGSEEVVVDSVVNQPNLNEAAKQPLTFQDFLDFQKAQNQGIEPPKKPHPIQKCWNCGKEQLGEFAGDHDVCSNCGFDRSKIFNLALLER